MNKLAKKLPTCALAILMVVFLLATPVVALAVGATPLPNQTAAQPETTPESIVDSTTDDSADDSSTPEDGAKAEPKGTVGSVMQIGSTGNPDVFDPSARVSAQYADFSFGSVRSLRGIFTSVGLYVTMPEYTVTENATLRVSYTCSDLILEHLSSLTFSLNGTPFFSCPVVHDPTGPTVVYIDVPLSLFVDEYNHLEISGYVRLTDDEGCVDDYMGANWINLEPETVLRLGYSLIDDRQQLRYYPYPFLSKLDESGADLALCVSDEADDDELTAALLAMTNLGADAASRNDIAFGRYSEVAAGKKLILFALEKNLPGALSDLVASGIPAEGSALLKRGKQGGREVLLVVSKTGDGLLEAARLLGDNSRIKQIAASDHTVQVGDAELLMQNSVMADTVVQGQYALKEIAGHGLRLAGPFHQETTIYLPVPNDYVLSDESKFTIRFRYSENLDFTRSLVTVYWGDIPITSKKLTLEESGGDSLTFVPPADLVGASGTSMRIAFELEIEDMVCTPRQMDMPWAYVAEDSTFFLPLGTTGNLNLANLPAPYQRDGELNNVLAVVSDELDAGELLLLGRTFAMLGSGGGAYGSLKVIRADAFDAEDADYNIVTCGTPANNAFLRQVNDRLYIRYNDTFSAFVSNEKFVMDDEYAKTAGVMQIMRSPYSDERALMVLTSPADDGVSRLTSLLSSADTRWSLKNDAVVLDQYERITSYQFLTYQQDTKDKPDFFERISQNPQSVLFTIIAIGVMLILLLAVMLVLVRIRARRKHGNNE